MPSYSRREQYASPTRVSLNTATTTNPGSGPSSPVPSSPKAVRFAPRSSELVTGVSRPLTPTEAWSLYHFETHARTCPSCTHPSRTFRHGGRLCDVGRPLAHDVAMHVANIDGEVCSTTMESGKLVHVEVPHGYDSVRSLLKGFHQSQAKSPRPSKPILTYEVKPPVSAMRQQTPDLIPDQEEVYVEPSRTPSTRKSKYRSTRYQIITDENSSLVSSQESGASKARRQDPQVDPRRGSLYRSDTQRPRKEYQVEIREPSDVSRRREKDRRKEDERAAERENRDERRRREKRRGE